MTNAFMFMTVIYFILSISEVLSGGESTIGYTQCALLSLIAAGVWDD